jgi:hypothetical protein
LFDHLLRRQYNRLVEIQQIQIELLEEFGRKNRGRLPVSNAEFQLPKTS